MSPMDRGEVPPYVEHHGAPDDRSVSPLTASQYHDASAFHCKGGSNENAHPNSEDETGSSFKQVVAGSTNNEGLAILAAAAQLP